MRSEPSLIEELYDEFHKDVYHFSLYFTNNKEEAEDITQDTFIKVIKNLYQLKDMSKRKTWILSIARNTAVDLKRKQKLLNFFPQILLRNQQHSFQDESNDKRLMNKEDWSIIQEALLHLKPHYRTIVILRALKELSVKETAEILGCSEAKVSVDFHRAVNKLRKELHVQEGWDYLEESK